MILLYWLTIFINNSVVINLLFIGLIKYELMFKFVSDNKLFVEEILNLDKTDRVILKL